jgi:hypothetical protein
MSHTGKKLPLCFATPFSTARRQVGPSCIGPFCADPPRSPPQHSRLPAMPARPLHLAAALSLPAGHRWIRGRDLAHVPIRPIPGRVLSPAVWENPARAPRGTAGDGSCSAPGLLSLSSSCLVSSRLQLRHHFRYGHDAHARRRGAEQRCWPWLRLLRERRVGRSRCYICGSDTRISGGDGVLWLKLKESTEV